MWVDTGTINANVDSTSQCGRISVSGTTTLGGTLNIAAVNGFTPTSGQNFQFMTYASRTGTFATVNGTSGGGLAFNPTYNATNLTLTVGPSAAPGLEAPPLLAASVGEEIYHEAHEGHEGHEGKKRKEVFGDLKLDVEQSAALTRATGKDWLFFTME